MLPPLAAAARMVQLGCRELPARVRAGGLPYFVMRVYWGAPAGVAGVMVRTKGGACRVVKLVVPGLGCDDADGADPHRRQNAGSRVDARLARRIFHPVDHRAAYEMPETEPDGVAEVYLHTPIQI